MGKFTLSPRLMSVIHKQFTESDSKTSVIRAILKAQSKTRRAVYEIVNSIPSGLGDEVLRYYQGVSLDDKTKTKILSSLTVNEAEHLARRHARHVKAWHTTDWKMELPKDDKDFIEGLRASRRPVVKVAANKFWE